MDRPELSNRFKKIGYEYHRIEKDLFGLKFADAATHPNEYNRIFHKSVISGEYNVRRLRQIGYQTTYESDDIIAERAAVTHGINIKETNGIMEIELPCVLPGRKKINIGFVTDPLFQIIKKYSDDNCRHMKRFRHCVICVTHVYDKSLLPHKRTRAIDNLETKWILSTLEAFLPFSKSGSSGSVFVSHELSDKDMTRVSIMDRDAFPEWLKRNEQNFMKAGDADMDYRALYERIDGVSGKIRRLQQDITALQYFDMNDMESYGSLLSEAAIKSEFIVHKLRQLVFDTTEIPKGKYLAAVASELDISVTESGGMVEITVPCLLARRNTKPTDLIVAPLQEMLSRFVAERPHFERFGQCVICFTHVYGVERYKKWGTRDHDNIEIKSIIDSINLFLLTDDAGSLCSIYNSSEISDVDMTRISIMKRTMFFDWIVHQKGMS